MNTLRLEIVTPEGEIFDNDVKSVTLPGSEGEFGVLPGHAALVSLLKAGVIEIEKIDNSKEAVAINWGHAKVDEKKVMILAEGAIAIGSGSESATKIAEARKLIESMGDSDIAIVASMAKIEHVSKY